MAWEPHGAHLIAGDWVATADTFPSEPASGPVHRFSIGTPDLVAQACAAAEAAFWTYAYTPRDTRAAFLDRIADEIDARGPDITVIGTQETGLPAARLEGERGRTVMQLRLFASHIRKGDHLDRRIDPALPDRQPLPRPEIRLIQRPIGPVAVFGALMTLPFAIRAEGLAAFRPRRPLHHLSRAVLLFSATFLFFQALKHLPIADALAIFFVNPLIVTILSALVLRERVGPRRWAAGSAEGAAVAPDALALRQFAALGELTLELVEAAARDGALAFWVADDYLRATALALLAWAWARIERTLAAEGADRARQWLPAARAMRHWVLPEFDMRASIIRARCTASEAARTD